VAAGNLGRKSGAGYYSYAEPHQPPVSSDEVLEKSVCEELLVAYLGDAIDMVDRGYASKVDIDAGMRLGCGLPFGPWEEIDKRGLDTVRAQLAALRD
jgi:3-hydroxybutyryl-CoA dehydrogenase